MPEHKKEIIYDIIIRGMHLNKTVLLKSGFNEHEINELLEEGFLKQVTQHEYQIYSLYEIYYYGLRLLSKQDIHKANACFKRCHQLDPNNRTFILQLFLKSLKLHDYQMAMKRLSKLETIEPEKCAPDNNLYLYLLNMINPCDKEYEDKINNIDYDSVLLPQESNVYRINDMNKIRHLIMKYQYRSAMDVLKKIIFNSPVRTIEQEVLRELIEQVIQSEKEFKLSILDYAQNKEYDKIYLQLKLVSNQRYLSNIDTYIYLISKSIIDIKYTGVIPESTIANTKCIYEALKGNNFALAKNINDEVMQYAKPPLDNQIIDVMLKDINEIILSMQNEQKDTQRKNISYEDYLDETEELAYYLKEENISIKDATKTMGIIQEQVLLIKLIYARDYYTEEMYTLGDSLVKEVEKSKDKTSRVIKFLNEVRTNKKFYKHRIDVHTKKLKP